MYDSYLNFSRSKSTGRSMTSWIGCLLLLAASNAYSQQPLSLYIDSISGSDANNGSLAAPFATVAKLNNMTLVPGTNVYLKTGCSWTGEQLKFKGSGTADSPIVINSYGTGAKPLLAGNGLVGEAVVYLSNQSFIEINNLEITNSPGGAKNASFFVGLYQNGTNPLGADRRGVMVAIDNYGTASHLYFKNLYVHHVKGQLGSGQTTVNGAQPKRTGGIYFSVLGNKEKTSSRSRFDDVVVDSCTIAYCENIGLAFDNEWNVYYPAGNEYSNWFNRRFSNVKITRNIVHHIGKNAMILRCTDSTGLVERNVCYETALGTTGNTMFTARARGTVFQYNEGYYNRSTKQTIDPGTIDGSMYDPDLGSVNVVFQYSYSHDNSHGLYWGCNSRSSTNTNTNVPDPDDKGCTARYNISQNDLGDLVFFNYPSAGNEIYNNVFYIKSGLKPNIIHENGTSVHTYSFRNNIIYNMSNSKTGADFVMAGVGDSSQYRTIAYNVFYGNHHASEPSDAFKIIQDPLLISPGSGTFGLATLDGYKLRSGSPCINSGASISGAPSLDFWGNAVPAITGTSTDRGAYEYPATVPISFVYVNCTALGNGNRLEWSTTDWPDNKGFWVERSFDGQNFQSLAFVPVQNYINGGIGQFDVYAYIDAPISRDTVYYRLKQLSKDCSYTYSEIVSAVPAPDPGARTMKVFPNPLRGNRRLGIAIGPKLTGQFQLKLVNQEGKTVWEKKTNIENSQKTLYIDLPDSLPKGPYYLSFYQGNSLLVTQGLLLD